jgi:hypothetical protein
MGKIITDLPFKRKSKEVAAAVRPSTTDRVPQPPQARPWVAHTHAAGTRRSGNRGTFSHTLT